MHDEAPTLGDALRRHWYLVTGLVLLFAALGVAVAALRIPTWESSSGLSVGRNNLSVQSIPGFAVGGQAVADTLSRSVGSPQVIERAARRLRLNPAYVQSHVSATPVNRTAVLTVTGEGKSAAEAVAITNAATDSLRRYAEETQRDTTGRAALLTRYTRVYRRQVEAEQAVERLREAEASNSRIAAAETRAEALRLGAASAKEAYRIKELQSSEGAIVEVLAPARLATSDRGSQLQFYGLLGGLAGALLGTGVAVLLVRRRRRRAVA